MDDFVRFVRIVRIWNPNQIFIRFLKILPHILRRDFTINFEDLIDIFAQRIAKKNNKCPNEFPIGKRKYFDEY